MAISKEPPKLASENILTLPFYEPGKPIEEVERELGITGIVKLASNENPLGPSPLAIEAMRKVITEVHRYPDAMAFKLREKLSGILGVHPDQIGFGTGANQLISLACIAFLTKGDEAIIPSPSFSSYRTAVQTMDATGIFPPLDKDWKFDLNAILKAITDKTKMIFICNPNNPTGTYLNEKEVSEFLDKVPDHIVVILDEAYCKFVEPNDFPDSIKYLKNEKKRIIILRTFSKIYGIAGVRIGYGIASKELASILRRVRPPFNASVLAQAAAFAALDDDRHVERTVSLNSSGKHYFYKEFDRLGLKYAKSEANFVFFDTNRDGREVFNKLLREGVIVRPIPVNGDNRYIRVSMGLMEENKKFIKALEKVLPTIPELVEDM
jgi:histidinol-phosphate aminotransferase